MAHFLNMNAREKDLTAVQNKTYAAESEIATTCPDPFLCIEVYMFVNLISLYFGYLFFWSTKPANWPQAAAISLPLVVRTVTE